MNTQENYKAWEPGRKKGTIEDIVAYGLLAPSSHNTQPWKFVVEKNVIKILPDYGRSLPYSDRFNRELFISIGCAWANCEVAAEHFGYSIKSEILPEDEIEDVAVKITCTKAKTAKKNDLFAAITERKTNRFPHTSEELSQQIITLCTGQMFDQNMSVHIINDAVRKKAAADIAADVAEFVYADPVFKKELQEWLRPVSTKEKDGIALFDAGVPAKITEMIVKNITEARPKEEAERDWHTVNSSTGLFVLTAPDDSKESWLFAGRATEYCWLNLTNFGVSLAPMGGFVEHPVANQKLMKLLKTKKHPLFFARIGFPRKPTHVSPRRPLEDVLKRSL